MSLIKRSVLLALSGLAGIALADTVAFEIPVNAEQDPPGTDVHMAYEWSTFDANDPTTHQPGAVLSAPGDSYSYTVIRSDSVASDHAYEIVRALIGIHIDDSDPDNPGQKWARIEINGKPRPFIIFVDNDEREAVTTEHVEIISDATLTGTPGSTVPPYIFDIQDILESGENVRISITNLTEDGTVDGDGDFGGFVINRVGSHVWYRKR